MAFLFCGKLSQNFSKLSEKAQLERLFMTSLDLYLQKLQTLSHQQSDLKTIQEVISDSLVEEHELFKAYRALLLQQNCNSSHHEIGLKPLPSGAIPLFEKSFFPWKALPYPDQHALLGSLLTQLKNPEADKMALGMIPYQEATLSHKQVPLPSFFSQHADPSSLQKLNHDFFKAVNHKPSNESYFLDSTLGIYSQKKVSSTIVCMASGCKSGMGIFLSGEEGVINFAPQLSPLGDCTGFGLAGRGDSIQLKGNQKEFELTYCCRLAAPSQRGTVFFGLKDSGFSGCWLEAKIYGDSQQMMVEGNIEGFRPTNPPLFTFFGKAQKAIVGKIHQLQARSLDRYHGPVQTCSFGNVQIEIHYGMDQMELLPLAGDASFWGADFLASFELHQPQFSFQIKI